MQKMIKLDAQSLYFVSVYMSSDTAVHSETVSGEVLEQAVSDLKEKYPDNKRIIIYDEATREVLKIIK